MGRNQLIIDNQIADVYSESDVITAVSYMVSNINNVEGSNNPTTKEIKLPGTSRNKRIFGFADDLNVTDFKGQKINLIGTIREGGTDILTGVVNLKNVTRTGIEVVFNITIIGNSGEWVKIMQDANLNGIDLGCTHLKTAANIAASLVLNSPYAYGLVNNGFPIANSVTVSSIEDDGNGNAKCMLENTNGLYGLQENILFSTQYVNGFAFGLNVYNAKHKVLGILTLDGVVSVVLSTPYMGDASGILRDVNAEIYVESRPLMINVRTVLQKIFSLSGYQILSSFIDTEFFRRLYMLPGKEKRKPEFVTFNATKAGVWGETTNSSSLGVRPFVFPNPIKNDALMYNASTGKFTATEAMHVVAKASFTIKGTADYSAHVVWNLNTPGAVPLETGRSIVYVTISDSEYTTLEQEAEFRMAAGDWITAGISVPMIGGDLASFYIGAESYLEVTVTDKVIKNTSMVPGQYLPEVKQIEFIKAIRHAFNLYFLTDIAMKTVYIEPRNTFYKSDKFIDLSDKLDISQPIIYEELGSDLTKTIAFRYKSDDNDQGVKDWEKANNTRYSTYVASVLNKFAGDGETIIENGLLAPTLMASYPAIGISTVLPKIWQALPENDKYPEILDEFTPRLLYFAGVRNCITGESWKFEGTTQTSYPLFCSHDPETGNANSLMFDPTALEMELYGKHYDNYIRTLNEGRRITAYFKLTSADIQALMTLDSAGVVVRDFRSLLYFRHKGETTPCRLDSVVEYKPGVNATTKVILVTDVDNTFNNIPWVEFPFTNNVLSIPAAHANGCVYLASWNWAYAHDRATGQAVANNTTHGIGTIGYSGVPYTIERAFLFFDTSAIPDGATIYEAYLDIYKLSGDMAQEFTVFEGTQANILTSSDYQHFGSVAFGQSDRKTLGLRRVYLNTAGIAAINKAGFTKYCLRESYYDVGNIAPYTTGPTFRTYFTGAPLPYVNKLTIKYTL